MTTREAEKFVKAMKEVDIQKYYREQYGNDWRIVYEEDKANNCLLERQY